jgi:hypothetical protein
MKGRSKKAKVKKKRLVALSLNFCLLPFYLFLLQSFGLSCVIGADVPEGADVGGDEGGGGEYAGADGGE